MRHIAITGLTLAALIIFATPGWADRLEELEKKLQTMQEQQQGLQAEYHKLLQEVERLKVERSRFRENEKKRSPVFASETLVAGAQQPPEEAPPRETISIQRALVTKGNILLRQGQIEVEPSIQYAHFSTQQLSVTGFSILPALVIGEISTQRIQRDIIIPALTIRGGIFDWLQGDVLIPYRWQQDRVTDSLATEEAAASNHGIGDIEGGLALQILRETGWVPDLILSFRYKSRTGEDPFEVPIKKVISPANEPFGVTLFEPALGTGFETFRPGFTLLKSVDPAILFGGFGLLINRARDVTLQDGRRAHIAPGTGYEFNVGLAFALNPDISLNAQYIQRFASHTEFDDRKLSGTTLNVGTANLGFTWALTRYLAMDFTLGIGLTEDAPDVTAQVRFPFRFSLK